MRYQIQFNVGGTTIEDIVKAATATWRDISGDPAADLPGDTEIDATQDSESKKFTAIVFVRGKV
jgi:hypothetical protein